MNEVMDLTSRPVYGLRQVDKILGLSSGTSRRWIDGYSRSGKSYPPVVREHPTGDEIVTWGEFVETRLLAEYRDAGVPLLHMRPAIDQLRALFDTPYPLASSRAWLDVNGRELILQVQDDVKLDRKLSLVVRSGQGLLDWAEPARDFQRSAEWENECVRRIRPEADIESALGLGKVLAMARKDTVHVGHALIPECPLGALDPDWIHAVAARGLVAVGRDKHIRTRPAEVMAIRDSSLRVLRIGGKRDLPTCRLGTGWYV